jgi:rhodanese-related sulfurtransferase
MHREISVQELGRWRAERKQFVLLDVREPDEIATVSIEGSTFVPMNEIPQRYGELPKDRSIAVLCHMGGRSERVAAYLSSVGFDDVVNVDGGIDAYARLVDPSLPRY